MPRQPYPSYNIHDYWDIDVSCGPRELVIELVQECHRRGMRIILDVLLHGVLDYESIGAAADGVRSGPFAELVASETKDSFGGDVNDSNNYLIAWSRHILDFEPCWRDGSTGLLVSLVNPHETGAIAVFSVRDNMIAQAIAVTAVDTALDAPGVTLSEGRVSVTLGSGATRHVRVALVPNGP